MTQYANTFEGGTNGTTITAANSGGTSGDAFDTVTIGATGTLAFDNTHAAHASLAMKVQNGGTASSVYGEKVFPAAVTAMAIRFYLYLTATPSFDTTLVSVLSGTTLRSSLSIDHATRKLFLRNNAGSSIIAQTGVIPLNQWVRVEVQWPVLSATVGQATLARYDTADSSTATETASTPATQNFGGSADRIRWGSTVAVNSVGPFWIDDIAQNDTAAAIGPIPGAASSAGSITLSGAVGAVAAASAAGALTLSGTATGSGGGSSAATAAGRLDFGATVTPTPVYLATFTVDAGMELSDIPLLPADTPTVDYVGDDDSDLVDYPDPTLNEWGRPIAS